MSDYGKASFTATFSEDANHNDPEWVTNWADYEVTPDEAYTQKITAETGGTTLTVSGFTGLTLLALKNLDPATGNRVDVTWTDNGANANTQRIPPGGLLVLSDVDPTAANIVVTANTAAVDVKVAMFGT